MKTIGETFGEEVKEAGLAGLPFSWTKDGTLIFDAAMPPDKIAAVESVLAAHDPVAKEPAFIQPADPLDDLRVFLLANPQALSKLTALLK